ncbi:hypothetical protein E4K10_48060 [Streptomyces sp. T1317-0309]|nr:hypothetical protein E4K10_48060 [Streptomyces sp. T1317-0309]
MLAVLKAGGAYVPWDPEYPADRIRTVLADARPVVVLTDGSCRTSRAGCPCTTHGSRGWTADGSGRVCAGETGPRM